MSIRSVADLWCFGTKNLTRAEVEKQLQNLWDDARAEGRTEGIEYVTCRIRQTADKVDIARNGAIDARRNVTQFTGFLRSLAAGLGNVDEIVSAREEYEEPTTTIRERLTENARRRDA